MKLLRKFALFREEKTNAEGAGERCAHLLLQIAENIWRDRSVTRRDAIAL
jgi:hypothetical protein